MNMGLVTYKIIPRIVTVIILHSIQKRIKNVLKECLTHASIYQKKKLSINIVNFYIILSLIINVTVIITKRRGIIKTKQKKNEKINSIEVRY